MDGSFGLIFAVIFLGNGVGRALGSYLAGLLRDLTGSYLFAFLLFMGSLWVACLLIWQAAHSLKARLSLLFILPFILGVDTERAGLLF